MSCKHSDIPVKYMCPLLPPRTWLSIDYAKMYLSLYAQTDNLHINEQTDYMCLERGSQQYPHCSNKCLCGVEVLLDLMYQLGLESFTPLKTLTLRHPPSRRSCLRYPRSHRRCYPPTEAAARVPYHRTVAPSSPVPS